MQKTTSHCPWRGKLWDNMGTGEPHSRILAADCGFTENIGNLGKLRQLLIPKAWHIHRNPPHGEADFYPLFTEVGNGLLSACCGRDLRRLMRHKLPIAVTVHIHP